MLFGLVLFHYQSIIYQSNPQLATERMMHAGRPQHSTAGGKGGTLGVYRLLTTSTFTY
jgi:hypothetical protein